MTAEEIKIVLCVFAAILIFYFKMFGGKKNENR